jgi:iron complex outermembrane receptor protein
MALGRKLLQLSTAFASIAASIQPGVAQAQTMAPPSPLSSANAATSDSDEIIVTARKREERLEDVPSSVTFLDGQFLQDQGVGSGKDLTRVTPGLYVIDNGSGFNDEFLIRGEGASRQNNAETGAGLFRNGVFVPGGNAGGRNYVPIDFFDVGSVTVLRGPQGSFYGRNALGGAVDIISQRPSSEVEVSAELSYGTNRSIRQEVVANLPLADSLQLRIGGLAAKQSDGFYTSSITGAVLDEEDSSGYRAQLAWQPSPTFDVNFLIERSDEFGPFTTVFGQVLPENDPPYNPVGAPSGFSIARFSKPIDTPSFFDRSTRTNILEASWDLGPVTVETTTAQRKRFARTQSDVDAFGNNKVARLVPALATGSELFERVTQDLRLVSNSSGSALDWLIGLEYNKVDSTFRTDRFADALRNDLFDGNADVPTVLPAACSVAPTCTLNQIQTQARNTYRVEDSGVDDTSYAGYAALTWRITDALQLSLDTRYSSDEKNFRLTNVFRLDNPSTTANEQLTRSVLGSETFDKWTPSVALNWRPMDDLAIYGRVATGYRAGGYNNDLGEIGDGVSSIALPLVYNAEFVTAYETGVRGRISTNFRYDFNLYYNKKQDTLVNYSIFVGTAATNTVRNVGVLGSAGDSVQYGLDGQLSGRIAFLGGTLLPRLSFSWASGEYEGGSVFSNQQSNPAATLVTVSLDGNKLQRLREWTTATSLTWRRPIFGDWTLMAMISQRGEYGGYEDPNNLNLMDDVSLYDAALGIESGIWRFAVSGKNIFDTSYFNISPGNQAFPAQQNEPATWRATLSIKY